MMTVLDSPESRETVFPMSVEFYHEAGKLGMIGEEVELLEGVLFKKMPKSPLHEWLVEYLRQRLEHSCPAGFFVAKERPITCVRSEPEPDLAVFPGVWTDYRYTHPTTAELIIEVAINTQQRDRSKAGIYAEAGVKEYWLVEPESKSITLYTQPEGGSYVKTLAIVESGHVQSTVFADFGVEVGEIFA